MVTGGVAFWSLLHHGHTDQLVPIMVTLGGIGHFILIVASLFAVVRRDSEPNKWWKFVGGGAIAVAYFAMIISSSRPH